MGALEPAEAGAPATPSNEAVRGSIETGHNPTVTLKQLRYPHTETSEENFHNRTLGIFAVQNERSSF